MPRERTAMRRIRDLLRYYYGEVCSQRRTARHMGMSRAAVQNYLGHAKRADLTWPLPDGMTDADLEVLLYPERASIARRPQSDWAEADRKPAPKVMTLDRVWDAYRQAHPDGYGYGHFCALHRNWRGRGTWSCDCATRLAEAGR